MNDNEPFPPAERNLVDHYAATLPQGAAANRLIVQQHIRLTAQRRHAREFFARSAKLICHSKPVTLIAFFVASSAFFLQLHDRTPLLETVWPSALLATLLLLTLDRAESLLGKPVAQGINCLRRANWRFVISPNYKAAYRDAHRQVMAERTAY